MTLSTHRFPAHRSASSPADPAVGLPVGPAARPGIRPFIAGGVLLAALLGGCAADPVRVPPSELQAFTAGARLEPVWRAETEPSGQGRFEPLVTEASVYVADAEGGVRRFERATGEVRWAAEPAGALASGVGGDDDTVYVAGFDGEIVALDAATGEERWRSSASSEVLAPVSTGFGALVVRSADGRLAAMDPATGRERWSASWTPPALTVNGYSRPLLLDGGLLVGLDDGRLLALNTGNGRPIWETALGTASGRSEVERLADIDADIRVDDEGIYAVGFQGRVARIEPARGQIVWSVPMSSTAGLAVDEDSVYVVDDESVVHALDKRDGRLRWSQDGFRGRRLTTPLRLGDALVSGDLEGYVHVLDRATGEPIARRRVARSAIRARPAGEGDSVVVQSGGGRVVALRLVTITD